MKIETKMKLGRLVFLLSALGSLGALVYMDITTHRVANMHHDITQQFVTRDKADAEAYKRLTDTLVANRRDASTIVTTPDPTLPKGWKVPAWYKKTPTKMKNAAKEARLDR